MPSAPIKTLVFDLDGVVLHFSGDSRSSLEKLGISRETSAEFFGQHFLPFMRGERDMKDVLPKYLSKWQRKESLDEFIEAWFDAEHSPDDRVLSEIAERRKQGFTCCLASNQEIHRARYVTKRMNLDNLFDHLFFSCDLGCAKPEREFFEKATATLGVAPDTILFIDNDSRYTAGAKAFGWNAILYCDFDQSMQELNKRLSGA